MSVKADTMLDRAQFADQIAARGSSFLAIDLATGESCAIEGSNLETRHAPWSTFKIPNTIIALETGVADSIDAWRDWDQARRPALAYWPDAWKQGQTLGTAFQRSAVWYYQDIALEVGAARYREKLAAWDYGNVNVPDSDDGFWLGERLALSVTEQVRFLDNLLSGKLDVNESVITDLIDVADAGPVGDVTLYGKTGAGPIRAGAFSGLFEGWYVGWVMQANEVSAVFAHHTLGDSFSSIRTYRRDFAEVLLAACGLTGGSSWE